MTVVLELYFTVGLFRGYLNTLFKYYNKIKNLSLLSGLHGTNMEAVNL